jgi:hypothetical protein
MCAWMRLPILLALLHVLLLLLLPACFACKLR